MKTHLRIFIVGFLVVVFAENSFGEDYNFRKTNWGMSNVQVMSSEPLDVAEENENMLIYKTIVIGKEVFVVYIFVDNQLLRARYVLAESHTNKNVFISDYNEFKEILTKKYGKPKQDDTFWANDLYKDDYSNWGMAISLGHLTYLSSWETQDTEIQTYLTGENYDISCIVEYRSKDLKELEEKAQEKKALDVF
ncbi:hypothetical protein ACFL50_03975 [Candidatus Latescibacterota bacterium]